MSWKRRVAGALATASLAVGGLVVVTAGAASAAPVCVADGLSREIRADGVPEFRNNPDCGELYQYDGPPLVIPEPDPTTYLPDGCLGGIVGDIACDRSQEDWTVPHPIWVTFPGGLPEITGYEHPDGTVTVGDPETISVGEGGGGGGWAGGGGGVFIGGGGSGGGGGTVIVGDPETVENDAE